MTTEVDDDLLRAVADSSGLRLVAARRLQSEAGPNGFVTGYSIRLADEHGQEVDRVVYVETTPPGIDREGVIRLQDETGDERAVWVYPNDPNLPALADAVVPQRARGLLERLTGAPVDGDVHLDVTAYRPGKRAVVKVSSPSGAYYLKVVAPEAARRIHERHAAWRAAGVAVPPAEGWSQEGVVAIAEQPGMPAASALGLADPERLLDSIDELREQIAQVPSDGEARGSLARRIDWYLRRVRSLAPELEPRLQVIGAEVSRALGSELRRATIHGDLHLGQLFVDPEDPSRVVGVIDIDTAGAGDPADDAAALWAHLVATKAHAATAGDPARSEAADDLARRARLRWRSTADRARGERVAAIAATHLLGHALTGVLTPQRAVAVAERVLGLP